MKIPVRTKIDLDVFDPSKPTFFDLETRGLFGEILLVQYYQEHWGFVYVVDFTDEEQKKLSLEALKRVGILVGHNLSYDLTLIQRLFFGMYYKDLYPNIVIDDTLLMARIVYPHWESHALDFVFYKLQGRNVYDMFDKKLRNTTEWDVNDETHMQYSATDVYYLADFYNKMKHIKDKDHEQYQLYELVRKVAEICFDVQNNGFPFLEETAEEEFAKNLAEIESYNIPINPRSYQQVRKWLGDAKESNENALLRMVFRAAEEGCTEEEKEYAEKAERLIKVRKLKTKNSWITKWQNEQRDGKVYSLFYPVTETGRLKSSKMNLQQISRQQLTNFGYKPDDGRVLIYADYSQLELRCYAASENDKQMIHAFRNNLDLHDITTRGLYNDENAPKDKAKRFIGKCANFQLLYGSGPDTFRMSLIGYGVNKPFEECKQIVKKFKDTWPDIKNFHNKAGKMYKDSRDWANQVEFDITRMWHTPLRRYYYATTYPGQLNNKIQAFGAEVSCLAILYLYEKIKGKPFTINNLIHDAFILSCEDKPEYYEECAQILIDCMGKAWRKVSSLAQITDLPMPVGAEVGYNWGKIVSGEEVIYKIEKEY